MTALRNSIVRIENGAAVTEPFDLKRARAMYLALFGPVDGEVRGLKHLIFEPDGPMLQLPPWEAGQRVLFATPNVAHTTGALPPWSAIFVIARHA